MSIRSTISDLLARGNTGVDPSAELQDDGFGEISAEEFGTALSHFSDTATLAEADALAPLVTLVGPVPLSESDIPEIDTDADGGDAFSLFGQAVGDLDFDLGEIDIDESDLSDPAGNSPGEDGEHEVGGNTGSDESDEDVDLHFGEPTSSLDPELESPDDNHYRNDPSVSTGIDTSDEITGYDEFDSSSTFDGVDTGAAVEGEQEPEEVELAGGPGALDAAELDDDFDDLDVDG